MARRSIAFQARSIGIVVTTLGLLTFIVNHFLWDWLGGTLPGYQIILYPGNLSLIHFWHPVFSEEVNFWPKLLMLLTGQFVVTTGLSYGFIRAWRFLKRR